MTDTTMQTIHNTTLDCHLLSSSYVCDDEMCVYADTSLWLRACVQYTVWGLRAWASEILMLTWNRSNYGTCKTFFSFYLQVTCDLSYVLQYPTWFNSTTKSCLILGMNDWIGIFRILPGNHFQFYAPAVLDLKAGFLPGGWGSPHPTKILTIPPSDTCPHFWTMACPPPAEVRPRKFEKFKYIFVSNLTTFKLKSTLKSCISCLK